MNFGGLPPTSETLDEEITAPAQSGSTQPSTTTALPQQVKSNLMGTQAPATSTKNTSGLEEAKKLISPIELIKTASEQIGGPISAEEQQRQQAAIQKDQQQMAQERQNLERFRQAQTLQRQQQKQTNATLAEEASRFSEHLPPGVGDSRSEQTLLETIISTGQKHQATQTSQSAVPQSPAKGPNLGNTKPKADMMAAMQPDRPKAKKSEPAAHELPLGE